MAFHESLFPTDISYGSRGGPRFNTKVVELDSGAEERSQRWTAPKFMYDAAYGIKDFTQLDAVAKFFMLRQGATYGFRWKDFLDFTSASNNRDTPDDEDQVIGTGDASETQFQLSKTYTTGAYSWTRPITKPVEGSVVVALNGAAQTLSSDFSVDLTTGIITFASAPGSGVSITAGFEFNVPCRFGTDIDQEGLFQTIDSFESGSIPSIPIQEDKEGYPNPEQFYFGGAKDHGTTSGQVSINVGEGRVHRFNASSALEVLLPPLSQLALGGPHFFLYQAGSATVTVRDNEDTTTVATLLAPTRSKTLLVGLDGSDKEWIAV